MTVEIEELLAWVDDELAEPRASEVGQAVLSDQNLHQDAEKLRASQLPYREAFEQSSMPDVPQSLRDKLRELRLSVAENSTVESLDFENADLDQSSDLQQPSTEAANSSSYKPLKMIGIAASVMFAATIGYLGGIHKPAPEPAVSTDVLAHIDDDFAQTVAAYQRFYVRETLKGTVAPNPVKVTERLASQTDMQVVIPELDGYQFMRAQRLSINGELLLQLIYLGPEGGPLALCYTELVDGDGDNVPSNGTTTALQNHHGLNTAEWRHSGHRFVIVSDAPEETLKELSQSTRQQWNI